MTDIGTAERWALEWDSAENPGSTGAMGDADMQVPHDATDAAWEDGWNLSYTADFDGFTYRAQTYLGIISCSEEDGTKRYIVAERDYIERDDDIWEMGDCHGGYLIHWDLDAAKREMAGILDFTRSFWQHAEVSDLGNTTKVGAICDSCRNRFPVADRHKADELEGDYCSWDCVELAREEVGA